MLTSMKDPKDSSSDDDFISVLTNPSSEKDDDERSDSGCRHLPDDAWW